MGFKKMKTNLTFTDLSLLSSIEKNRAITRMEQINNYRELVSYRIVDHAETILSEKVLQEMMPILLMILMKCLLLQQWFKIDSDPELETQINDRISFKKFLGLSFDNPAP